MKQEFINELSPDVKVKMKKNLVYVSIFSIVMLFAGLTSGYIVLMGDTFWVKYPLPSGFWISTVMIVLSSIFYMIALRFSKMQNFKMLKVFMLLTFVLGCAFAYFQFKGYGQLVDKGANFSNRILVTEGRYGDYFEIKYLDKFIEVNGNDYLLDGKVLNATQDAELKSFMKVFEKTGVTEKITSLSPKFTLYFEGKALALQQGKLVTADGKILGALDMGRLKDLAVNVRDGRGDFFFKGKLGKDFDIYFKGKKLDYKHRDLYYANRKLDTPLQLKLNQSDDMSTSYMYIITFLHLLHVLAALIYLFRMVLITLKPALSFDNQLSIKLGSIFWHFLGILWLYLLVFLLFIH